MSQDYALPRGSLILVTGANGFIASNIVTALLQLGYNVRGTVRTPREWLDQLFADNPDNMGKFESFILPGIEGDELEGAFEGVDGVIHIASDISLNPDADVVVPSVISSTLRMLEISKRFNVKRFVLTSSSTAALLPVSDKKDIVITTESWNDSAVKAAWASDTPTEARPYTVYAASKTEGERSAWKWVEENKPGFVLNTVLPNVNFGKILSPEMFGSTMGIAGKLLSGEKDAFSYMPSQWFIDVQDNARLHVIALLSPSVSSERLFGFAAPFNWTKAIKILRKLRPENTLIPDPPENEGQDLSDVYGPSARAEKLIKEFFGRDGWTSLEDSLEAGIRNL